MLRALSAFVLALGLFAGPAGAEERILPSAPSPGAGTAEAAACLEAARADGKYRMLLRQIAVPGDLDTYGEFRDWGPWSGSTYRDHANLPPGHWVYVHPYWYIWRDLAADERPLRRWGPERAEGAPDTAEAGDRDTAWTSATADGGEEWLLLEWDVPRQPRAILVHETFHPGALVKVTGFHLDGREVVLWEGTLPAREGKVLRVLPIEVSEPIARVKLHLDTARHEGWNEIDAVGLLDDMGVPHWADAAHASSYYGQPPVGDAFPTFGPVPDFAPLPTFPPGVFPSPELVPFPGVPPVSVPGDALPARLAALAAEVERLRAEIAALRAELAVRRPR